MIATTYPLRASIGALPPRYGGAGSLLSTHAALCLIELARLSYGPSPGSYGPLTVVIEPAAFAASLHGLPAAILWGLSELRDWTLLAERDGLFVFDPAHAEEVLQALVEVRS
jgi:hypothetical protein